MLKEYHCGEIYIRHAVDECPKEENFVMHIHDRCEIYFLVSGRMHYLVESTEYPLEEKSLMLMQPSEAHKAKVMESVRYERYAMNFPLSFAKKLDPEGYLTKAFMQRELGKNNYYGPTEMDMSLVEKLFMEMMEETEEKRHLTLTTHLLFLLDLISRSFQKKELVNGTSGNLSARMVSYVNRHLFEEISVQELAEQFYISSSQFGRIFKAATGAPPWEYIMRKRLHAAKEKIREGMPAYQAAERCGFGDYSAFYRAYLRYFGYAPTQDIKGNVGVSR